MYIVAGEAQKVVVERRDLHPALFQSRQNRVDLVLCQDEVAHHHDLIAHGLEREPQSQRQGRLDGDAIERDLKIRPGRLTR